MTRPEPDTNILLTILGQAALHPDSPCLDFEGRILTYAQLRDKVVHWGQALRAQGIAQGEVVGVVMRDFIDDVIARLAVMSLGAIPGSLDVFSKPRDRAATLDSYGMTRVIEDEACFSGLPQSIRADAAWIAAAEAAPAELRIDAAPDGAAQIIFTSGTSGAPVGAVQTHSAILALREGIAHFLHGTETRFLSMSWSSTAAGAYIPLLLTMGGGCVLFRPLMRDLEVLMRSLKDEGITFVFIPPNLIPGLVSIAKASGVAPCLPDLRSLIVSSAATAPDLLLEARHWLTPGISQVYGAGTVGMVASQSGDDLIRKPESVGRIVKGVDVQIVDDKDEPLPTGTVGRLRLRSAMASARLIGAARTQADRAVGGWNYPGDLALLDDEGFLFLAGREGDLINYGGMKIYPLEVEHALARCPGVKEVALVGIPAGQDGDKPVAFVVADQGVSETDIQIFSRSALPTWKRPAKIVLMPSLPRNPAGKVMKRELAKQFAAGTPGHQA